MSDSRDEGTVSRESAKKILERATDLEARGEGEIEVAELGRAALEAGIPLDAFERALAEARNSLVETEQTTVVANRLSSLEGWIRRASLAALGFAISAASAALSRLFLVDADAAAMFSITVAALVVLALALARRRDRSIPDFLFDLAPLWIGFTLSWMLVDPADAAAVLAGNGLVGSIAAIVGSLLVALSPLRHAPAELGEEADRPLLTP